MPGGKIGRLGFRKHDAPRYLNVQLNSIEPALLVVILAASEAVIIHDEQPRAVTAGGGG